MAESVFGDCMRQYQPGWEPEPEPEQDLQNHEYDTFRSMIPQDDPRFFPIAVNLMMLRRTGYDITDPGIVNQAAFLAEYNERRRIVQESLPPRPVDGSVVYYVRMRDLIKIGTTRRPIEIRAAALMADEVLATEPGSFKLESYRHQQFAHLRYRGERFYPGHDLLDHIAQIRENCDREAVRDSGSVDGRNGTEPADGQVA